MQAPRGSHTLMARAVCQPATGYSGPSAGKVYDSAACVVEVRLVPELATYQAGVTDLQLSAPGLPLVVSRVYDSRTTNYLGVLGQGWTAGWNGAVQLSGALTNGWVEAGRESLGTEQYYIAESAPHLVTVTLPGGGTEYFGAQLKVRRGWNPLQWGGVVELGFVPYEPGQGALTCSGNQSISHLSVFDTAEDWLWDGDELLLAAELNEDTGKVETEFGLSAFVYTAPEGTAYEFAQAGNGGLTWHISKVRDRNQNALAYTYNASLQLTNLAHANGRQIRFEYTTNGASGWVKVFDTLGGDCPVTQYLVTDDLLREVHRLEDRNSGSHETNFYWYGASGAQTNRLTDIYDVRGIRVLHNEYGTNSQGEPDGRLIRQVDALNRTNSFGIDLNTLTLTVTNVVNGTNQVVAVGHEAGGAISGVQNGAVTNHFTYDYYGRLVAQMLRPKFSS